VEQVVELDGSGDVCNWPTMYAVEVGHWMLPDDPAAQLREFLLGGGLLMVDDFRGDEPYHRLRSEWHVFLASMRKVFPDRPTEDLPDSSPMFHTVLDLRIGQTLPGPRLSVVSQRPDHGLMALRCRDGWLPSSAGNSRLGDTGPPRFCCK